MAFVNNTMIIRRELIIRMVKLFKEDRIYQEIDRIPIEISKRVGDATDRCCKHKQRAVAKYKIMALLGFGLEEETDELTPLSEYMDKSLNGGFVPSRFLTVVDEACTSCVKSNYIVTNLCKGCIAHPCELNCPKKAISRNSHGKAEIDPDKCVNCGICKELCPYHSIVYMPIPCEEACPVNAIRKDENGIERIDQDTCILCGKCINACPFGSVNETTQLFKLMDEIKRGEKITAIVAPSVSGQFSSDDTLVFGTIKALGFDKVINVALGAGFTSEKETEELIERQRDGDPFMTSSCCPSWMMAVNKAIPEIKPFVSHTPSPMELTARWVREHQPKNKIVFVGPCVAKRKEGQDSENVDYVITFEELVCWMDGWGVSIGDTDAYTDDIPYDILSQGYAKAGGVGEAIKSLNPEVETQLIDGLDKKSIRLLKSYAQSAKKPSGFVEVMACKGGCLNGCSAFQFPNEALRNFNRKILEENPDAL